MIESQRHLFDIPEHIAYFNCAYYSPILTESARRLRKGANEKLHPWNRFPFDFFKDAEMIRNISSNLFGGDADDYAIVPAVSYGLSSTARILEPNLSSDDSVLLMHEEFPAIVLPFRRIAQEQGIKILTAYREEGRSWTDALVSKINSSVKVVAISSCHWTNGAFIDLPKISKACK